MTQQAVTIQLPSGLYHQIEHRARRLQRSVEDELVSALTAVLPTLDDVPADVTEAMAQLAFLDDDELWRAAQTTLPSRDADRMQALMLKRQRDGLTAPEQREAERLAQRYDRMMLIRAQAAALLKERGYEITELRQVAELP